MSQNLMRQAGPFQAVEVYNNPDAKWVLLFHGYGADANDLAGLVSFFDFKKPCNWLFPNGPMSVPIGPGMTGRAWWSIRMNDLPGDWSKLRPDDMGPAVDKALKMISSMKIAWKDLIIGGFSQGAMLATEVFLKAPESAAGLLCLSGTLLSEDTWANLVAQRKNSKIFMSHGELDPVLPHRGSAQLQSFFEKNQIKTQFVSFRGGHEIPPVVLQKMKAYIEERL
jgi:phospholipase/carboxylesterase